MKSREMGNTPKVKEVTVNLDQKTKNPEEVSEGLIIVAYKRNILGSKDPEGTGSIKVDYTLSSNVVDKVVLDSNLPLLTLSCMGNKGSNVNIKIKKINEIPFTVRFDSNAIIDCIDPDVEEFKVNYTITATMDSDKEPTKVCGEITVKLQKLACKPLLSLKTRKIKYKAEKIENILKIQNSNTHAYARTLLLKPTAVYLEHGSEKLMNIVEIFCKKAEPSGPNSKHVPYGVTIIPGDSANPASHIRRIFPMPGYGMDVPISIDFANINNPTTESENYKLVVEYDYWTDDKPDNLQRGQEKIPFTLIKNDELNELHVELQYGNNTVMIEEDYLVPTPIDVIAEDFSYSFHIRIKNAASVKQSAFPNAGIVISKLQIGELEFDETSAFKGNTRIDVSSFVVRRTTGKQVKSGEVRLLPSESVDIELAVSTGQIDRFIKVGGIDVFNAYLRQNIKFQYFIDNSGRDKPSKWEEFNSSILFELEIPPAPEWMGVDFGTSAVVALYGNSFNIEDGRESNCICDLGAIKKELLKAAYSPNSEFATVRDESVFINSNIVLNDIGKINENFFFSKRNGKLETNYRQATVLFSPGDQFAYDKLMPSLKSMMGHKRVPSKDSRPIIREKMPLVNEVYQTVYNQLFDLYLSTSSQGRPVEKIVMTYPNTFATMHVQKLKDLAKHCMPSLRDDYIVTISESDAIAYKYLKHRDQLVKGKNADQHILVYDMGAGTLDITYFTNVCNREGVREVDIVGKYGINKAGNYLDYVLAEIVVDLCEETGHDDIGGVKLREYISYSPTRTLEIGTCYNLKRYVKDVLKPKMARYKDESDVPDDVMMPEWKGMSLELTSIPLKKVFQSSKFREYIKNISTDVVEGCRANINNMVVDVVVFSGRMTCFKSIRKAVVDALGSDTTIVVDITRGNGSSSLKSSVVEGALDYVETFAGDTTEFRMLPKRPFYCNYCVLIKTRSGIEVHCMMNNTTADYSATESVNLSNAIAIYLLQTYASDATAVKKDFEGKRDLTTILVAKDVQHEHGIHDLTVMLKDSGRNRFGQGTNHVSLMLDAGQVNALPHENLESESFRKSSWPVVFV